MGKGAPNSGITKASAAAANGGGADVSVSAYRSTTQALNNGAWTTIAWDLEHYDTDAFHDLVVNTSRFTIPAGKAGKYHLCFYGHQEAGDTAITIVQFLKNGAFIADGSSGGTTGAHPTRESHAADLDLAVGDFVEVQVFVNAAGQTLSGGDGNSAFMMHKFDAGG